MVPLKKTILNIFFFCLYAQVSDQFVPKSLSRQAGSCRYQYAYDGPDKTQFRFQRCIWTQCNSNLTLQDATLCKQHQNMVNYDWSSCSMQCCSENLPYAEESLNRCAKTALLNGQFTISPILTTIIFLGILFIIVFIIFSKGSKRLQSMWNCCQDSVETLYYFTVDKYWKWKILKSSQESKRPEIQIELIEKMPYMFQKYKLNKDCCVCKQPSPSIQLLCGHFYHRKCIADWLIKRKSCSLCMKVRVDTAKFYCQSCYNQCLSTDIQELQSSSLNNMHICGECVKNKK